jgi:cbb3-type cytochrome oxidase cytochrome c subunit
MERLSGIFLIAGLVSFAFAFVVMAVVPYMHSNDPAVRTVEELAPLVLSDFRDLEQRYPEAFAAAFPGGASAANAAAALREGRDTYIAEACWHCHSQLVRPVANEELRWGRISFPEEYRNELQMPPLMGTRRVGPDLIREAGRRSNDWHVAHFYNPRLVSPTSVMPPFPWFFTERPDGPAVPNRQGFAAITYVQWLGTWLEEEDRFGVKP